nr:probable E3 ubiquitin-protein ligase ZFP1 isoform X1 [Ipomoea batatas]
MPLTFMVSPFGKANRSSPTSAAFRSICVSSSVKAFSTFNDSRAEVSIKKVPSLLAKDFASSVETTHRDMRLDIDHMSYEELLALGEQIGWVVRGSHYKPFENKIVHFL